MTDAKNIANIRRDRFKASPSICEPPFAVHTVEWSMWIQEWINNHGASPRLDVDGNFGDASKNALTTILAKIP